MNHLMEYFSNPQPESGRGQHTQESGDAGFSSNLKHKFTDDYKDSAFPVEDKGSFVIPIPKAALDIAECPGKAEKIWSQPSHPVSAEKWFLKPSILGVEKNCSPPQVQLDNDPEDGTVKISPGTTAMTEQQLDVEVEEQQDTKMDAGGNPTKPNGAPLIPEKRRNNNCKKKAAGKNRKLYLLFWMAVMIVPVSASFAGAKLAANQNVTCFNCTEKDRCQKLMTIFNENDTHLYQREPDSSPKTFPGCSEISPPANKSCAVCGEQQNIMIICSRDAGKLEVEDSAGGHIVDISPVSCDNTKSADEQQQTPGHGRYGLIASFALFLIVVVALVIYRCRQRNRAENNNTKEHLMVTETTAI